VVDGGTWNLTTMIGAAPELRAALHEGGLFVPVLVLVGLGIAAKSAQVPLHVWLPDAMAAPTPVSAFLHSATMVKAGVYLAGRFRPLFLPATGGGHGTADAAGHAAGAAAVVPWTLLFASLGLVTMTVTAVLAVAAADVKELLAYSTASHLGLIVAGFGFGNAVGAAAGAFHMLNHALFKAALFLVAGIVAHETGTRRLAALGGLRRELPVTAAVAAVAGLSMAGLPPFNGFYSKELLFEAAYEAAHAAGGATWVLPALAVVGSVFTVLYSLRFLRIFFGTEREAVAHGRPGLHMLGPPALLALLAAAVGVSPGTAIDLLIGDAAVAAGGDAFHVGLPTKLKPPAVMSALAVGGGLLLYPRVDRLRDRLRSGVGRSGGLRPNRWYERGVPAVEAAGRRAVAATQTGRLRTYAVWALGGTVALGLGGYAVAGRLTAGALAGAPSAPSIPVVIVLLVAVGAALAVGRAPSHAAGVLTLSILGFMIAIFFVLARAPDLALTQLVVETLLLVVFLLVLDRLPAFYGALDRGRAARDAALSAAVGATVFCTVVLASGASPAGRVAAYFAARAGVPDDHGPVLVDFGGGANVVSVILVDVRAFDTLGEVSVVAMAAVAVLTLFRGVGS
jgi:multicomponent Na+:H+ antiporter subunit A